MKKRLIIGMLFFVLSYLLTFLNINGSSSTTIHLLFLIGSIFIFDAITLYFYKKSFLNNLKNKRTLAVFVIISFAGGFILELVVHWLGKLWVFPYFSWTFYLFAFVPGFAVYWLSICESYLAAKSVIDYFKKGKAYVTRSFGWENKFFIALGIIGFLLLTFVFYLGFLTYIGQSNPFIQENDLNQKTQNFVLPFNIILLAFVGLWFIFEFFEFKFKKTGLIKDILHEHWTPFLAIIIGSIVFGFIMETQNLFYDLWVYINWPLENIKFAGLPIVMLAVWPLHYILFLSLWRAFTDEQSEEVWKGDLIK